MTTDFKLRKINDISRVYIEKYNFFTKIKKESTIIACEYLLDMLPLLHVRATDDADTHIFNNIALLQIIYVQQDLVKELFQNFKIKNPQINGNEDRILRNKLIGHPVNYQEDKSKNKYLASLTLFGLKDPDANFIEYIEYNKDNNFKGDVKKNEIAGILNRHEAFMDTSFDKILKILKKKLQEFNTWIKSNITFPNDLNSINQFFDKHSDFLPKGELYNKEFINICFEKQKNHDRYKFGIDKFQEDLKENINEIKKYISQELADKTPVDNTTPSITSLEYVLVDDNNKHKYVKSDTWINGALGKLYAQDCRRSIAINTLKKRFKEDTAIKTELERIAQNLTNSIEDHLSCDYVKFLIKKQCPHLGL